VSQFVAVEIGCIECGNGSRVLGIFSSEDEARAAIKAAGADDARADEDPWGSYQARVFEVPEGGASAW